MVFFDLISLQDAQDRERHWIPGGLESKVFAAGGRGPGAAKCIWPTAPCGQGGRLAAACALHQQDPHLFEQGARFVTVDTTLLKHHEVPCEEMEAVWNYNTIVDRKRWGVGNTITSSPYGPHGEHPERWRANGSFPFPVKAPFSPVLNVSNKLTMHIKAGEMRNCDRPVVKGQLCPG